MEPQTEQQTPQLPPEAQPLPRLVLRRPTRVRKNKKKGDILEAKSRLDLFLEEYLNNGGNGTEAALKVFNVRTRANAAAIAHEYLQKAQSLGRAILEKKGITYEKMADLAYEKAKTEKTPEYWDRLMKMGGYEDFMTKQGVTKASISVLGVQKGLLDEYVDGEFVEEAE